MTLVHCPGLTCIKEIWQYHRFVPFQLSVKPEVPLRSQTNSHSLPNATLVLTILSFTSSSKCSALDIVLLISLSIYCDGWLIVVLSRCLLVNYLSLFQVVFKLIVVTSLYKQFTATNIETFLPIWERAVHSVCRECLS